jgi:outer membrane murein-binding lipoprotein Lpp
MQHVQGKEEAMYISFPSPKTRTVPIPVRHLVLIVVFASLAVAGCEQDKTADLEARIVKLESQVQAQERKIETLASAATLNRASVFDTPLRRFFEAREFWEVVYEDAAACHNNCYQAYKDSLEACKEEETEEDVKACELKAATEAVACHKKCEPSQ